MGLQEDLLPHDLGRQQPIGQISEIIIRVKMWPLRH